MAGLDTKRSRIAQQLVEETFAGRPEEPQQLVAQIKDLPTALRINGLLAVLLERPRMGALLQPWLESDESPIAWVNRQKPFFERLPSNRAVYRQASVEALAFAVWLKRWTEALYAQ